MYNGLIEILSVWLLPMIILIILVGGIIKKIPVYEIFVDGAKGGVKTGLGIVPYLVAIITAVSMLRASGAIELISQLCGHFFEIFKVPIEVLPIMLTRSLSGSATLGLLSDVASSTGVESYATKLAAIMVGSSETTFYVLAVYFGAVGIKKFRHAVLAGVLADVFGIFLAILVCNIFFN